MSKPSDFANVSIDEIVDALSQDEAIALTSGVGFWHTAAIQRLGVPAIKVRYVGDPCGASKQALTRIPLI